MTNAEKHDRIRQSLAEHPDWSNRQHAKALSVDHGTVAKVRATENRHPELLRDRGDGRLVALVDLIVERGNAELYFVAGQEVPGEVAHLPRRPAG
jgi:hypothetical protein